MPVSSRRLALACLTILFASATSVAGEKSAGPVVPGFARFHGSGEGDAVEGGRLLIPALKCRQCHQPNDGKVNMQSAPILDGIGTRVKRSYLTDFLSDPHKTKPGTTMPNLLAGLDDADKKEKVAALVHLLASTGSPTHVRPDAKGISAGRDLYHKVGCVACHGTCDAKGDQAKLFAASVPLGNLKAKYTLASLRAFLDNPHQTRPHGRMPGVVIGKEASDIANFLMQGTSGPLSTTNVKYTYYEGAWKSLPNFAKLKPIATGEATDFDIGVARRLNNCAIKFDGFLKVDADGDYTFHLTSDDGSKLWVGDAVVVNNDGVHPPQHKTGKVKLAKGVHKLVVGVFNAGGGFELNVEVEGPGIARQPLSPLVYPSAEAVKPKEIEPEIFVAQPALIAKGKGYFASLGCANCHQLQGEKKRLTATALEDLKPDAGCLSAAPKKGIPYYGLSTAQQTALKAALVKKEAGPAAPKVAIARTMASMNCYACHERDKIGGVTDDIKAHFTATFKEWGDEASIPPSLNGVGAKLNTAYFKKVLEQGAHDRSYMNTRMPKFGPGVTNLVELFEKVDETAKAPKVEFAEPIAKVKAAGRQIVDKQAFNCINCHNFGGVKTGGVQGLDMAIMTERLKKEWFHNYLLNPTKYRAGTRMPTSFPDGTTPLKNILGGKADAQIEAIWVYLADGKSAKIPSGMNSASIPLIPITEAILYRNFILGAGTRGIGVGYPERAHLAFDANDLRLAMIWQGGYIDARRHWTGRGEGFEPPMGDNIMHLPAGVSFYVLAKDDEAWPTKKAKELGYKFSGYNLSDDQRPTFVYSFNEIKIEDFPTAFETKANPAIRRTLTLTTPNPIDKLYYRAAVADKIDADKDGWFRINEWRMRIEAEGTPVIRKAGTKMELLVPVRFKGNGAKIVQEYVW